MTRELDTIVVLVCNGKPVIAAADERTILDDITFGAFPWDKYFRAEVGGEKWEIRACKFVPLRKDRPSFDKLTDKEIIQSIREFTVEDSYSEDVDGFVVKTNKQEILLGIENGQCCCENWGYFMSEDEFNDFIGAELLTVKIVDSALKVTDMVDLEDDETNVMFVNIETNKGVLQFVAYNQHNGYYAHSAFVKSNQLNYTEGL